MAARAAPAARFMPPRSLVTRNTTGLVNTKFEGATQSSNWRVTKVTTSAWWADMPRTLLVARCHHCCCIRNPWLQTLKAQLCQAGSSKRLSWASGASGAATLPAAPTAQ